MDNMKTRKLISAVVIMIMVASVFALPVISDDYKVDAAPKKVKVKYNANGGKFTAKNYAKKTTVTKKIKKGKKRGAAPTIKKTGYTFKGWYTKKAKGKKTANKTKIKKNQTLYARWQVNTYKVTFKKNDGTGDTVKNIKYGSKFSTVLFTPTRAGYKFMGWYTAPTGGKIVINETDYEKVGNTTLYARWKANKYQVSFVLNDILVSSASIEFDSKYEDMLYVPDEPGYFFKGWFTSATGGQQVKSGDSYKTAGNTNLYAQLFDCSTLPDLLGASYDDVKSIFPDLTIEDESSNYIDAKLPTGEKFKFTKTGSDSSLQIVYSTTEKLFGLTENMGNARFGEFIGATDAPTQGTNYLDIEFTDYYVTVKKAVNDNYVLPTMEASIGVTVGWI